MYGYKEQVLSIIDNSVKQFGKPADFGHITPDEVLEGLQDRFLVSRARAKLVRTLFVDNSFNNGQEILEIGTGTGELTRLLLKTGPVPNLIYSDINPDRVRKHLGQEAQVLNLDLNKLALPDSSQKAIVLYNLLDQFEDLKKPCSELFRVLSPDGKLIVLTDLQPDEYIFFRQHPSSYLIPISHKNNNQNIPYVNLNYDEAIEFGSYLPPAQQELWFVYMALEPWQRALISRLTYNMHMSVVEHNIKMAFRNHLLSFDPKIIDMAYYFHDGVNKALTETGFSDVKVLLAKEEFEGKPLGKQVGGNVYDYAFDKLLTRKDGALGNKVKEIAKMGVILASKPSSNPTP